MKNNRITSGKNKAVYVVGAMTLGIIALLAVYFVLIATGVISAEPTQIVISSASITREYDGTPLKNSEWVLEEGELKEGHTLQVEVTGSRTDAGESENTLTAVVYDKNGYDVSNSYAFIYKPGTITVAPRKIVVASVGAEKMYDGKPLTAKSCAITAGSLVSGHEISYYINGTLTASGKTANTFVATVFDGVRDVTANYDVEYLYGTLYVHGIMLNIATESKTKVFDGTPLTASGWILMSGKLSEGHELSVTVTGAQTEVGSSENFASCVVKAADGKVVTDMYEPVFTFGTLEVEPVRIYVETRPAYKIYDGTPLSADGWRIVTDSALANDTWLASGRSAAFGEYTVTASVIGSQTDAGTSDNTAVFVTVTRDGKEAEGVEIVVSCGKLTVAPRNITVQSGTAGKVYDGTPLTCKEFAVVSLTQVADGQSIEVAVSGTITYPGSAPNYIADVRITANGVDVTHNYNIKLQEGILTVLGEAETPNNPSNPGGEGGGGGSGDIDGSGALGGGGGSEGDPESVMRILGDATRKVYLRQMSYGDYIYNGWAQAKAYSATIEKPGSVGTLKYGMNYLAGIALQSIGLAPSRLEVQPLTISQYYLPYYLSMAELGYDIQSSDTVNSDNGGNYAAYYYYYDYIADGGKSLAAATLGEYSAYELLYRAYVYDNYLAVPASTLEYINGVIAENGFNNLSLAEKIAAVASFVRNCAKYNLKYDTTMDGEADVVVAFMDKYKEGVCRHYASAATLIFRALGIPARYTTGFAADASDGVWTDVTSDKGHAWTEVYIDGVGWIELEVTGGGAGYDGNDGEGGFGGDNSQGGNKDNKLRIKPFDVYLYFYDFTGEPLTYELDTLQGLTELTALGYRYEFTVSGEQKELGIGVSRIESFTLFDSYGNDVTDEFDIVRSTGKLHIYMQEISLSTASHTKMYDGKLLIGSEDDVTITGTLLFGHTVESIKFTGGRYIVGRSVNTCELVIADENGNDVTYMYKINAAYGTLTVTTRSIEIVAGSAIGYSDELDGEPLTCDEYEITDLYNSLAEGDTIIVTIEGEQSGVGLSENVIVSVVIINAAGVDVTGSYSIKITDGTLIVLPGSAPNKEAD